MHQLRYLQLPMRQLCVRSLNNAPLAARCLSSLSSYQGKAKLVIYDKDGTIIDFDKAWTPWVKKLAQKMSDAAGMNLYEEVYVAMGYDNQNNRWLPGYAQHNTDGIWTHLANVMKGRGFNSLDADAFVRKYYVGPNMESTDFVQPIKDVKSAFRMLKENGIKIAVCTSDERSHTLMGLKLIGVRHLVDQLHCGDDEDAYPKPDPRNIENICHQLAVKPSEAVMIGDYIGDVKMGKDAGVLLSVGVLSGISQTEHFEGVPDVVLPDHEALLPLILESSQKTSS